MSETNNRPIYVKKQKRASKRRRQPERLHGAFSGGFSAGHFNTVGSKNGWKPPDADADADTDADADARMLTRPPHISNACASKFMACWPKGRPCWMDGRV